VTVYKYISSRQIDHRAVHRARRRVRSTVGDRSSTVLGTRHASLPSARRRQVLSTPDRLHGFYTSRLGRYLYLSLGKAREL